MFNERRSNWKEELGKAAKKRREKRNELLARKDEIAQQIKNCGLDFDLYDRLKQQQREIVAELAAL